MKIVVGLIEHIGDIVACEPVPRYLKQTYPTSTIFWVVLDRYRELIDSNPYIDETIIVDCLTEWMSLVRHASFDLVVDLHVNYRICPHCRIPLYKTTGNRNVDVHQWFDYGSILEAFSVGAGLPKLQDHPQIYIENSHAVAIDDLGLGQTYCVIHRSSNDEKKDWRKESWDTLLDFLIFDLRVMVVEVGKDDFPNQPAFGEAANRKYNDMYVDLRNRTSILETAEVIRRCKFFVGIDSGPAHMANACKSPAVILLGRFHYFRQYVPFSGYYASDAGDVKLIQNLAGPAREIPIGDVIDAIKYIIAVSAAKAHKGANREKGCSVNLRTEPPLPCTASADLRVSVDGDALLSSHSPEGGFPPATVPKLLAFYLPQFHPIQENNYAHGMGFSEWHNIIKTTPLFKGHYQPRIPGELGFYDLRSPDVLFQQVDMALAHGIAGFCFYFYYFKGKRLLYRPIMEYIRSDMRAPFCFLWANENWTKRWDGGDNEVIVEQHHSSEDDLVFIRQLFEVFDDDRYLKIDGKPVLLIYKVHLFPDIRRTAEIWRSEVEKAGYSGIYLIMADDWQADIGHPREFGFDASYEIPSNVVPEHVRVQDLSALEFYDEFEGLIVDYYKFANFHFSRPDPAYKRFRTVMLPWDNTPRAGRKAMVHVNADNDSYKMWLMQALVSTSDKLTASEGVVFIHSWNEWCEGTYLEPDGRRGRAYLEQTREAVSLARDVITMRQRADVKMDATCWATRMGREREEAAFRMLSSTRSTVRDISQELDHLKGLAHSQRVELEHLRGVADAQKREIDLLRGSTSWRLTGPLRAASRFVLKRE